MFEGYIVGKFANKMFEKDVFKIVKRHAMIGALLMMIPDFGFGTIFYIAILWHMYSSIAKKVGLSFSDNFWKLVGFGFFVNVFIALVVDVALSFLFFLEPFIIYLQFYLSGKVYIESLKKFK